MRRYVLDGHSYVDLEDVEPIVAERDQLRAEKYQFAKDCLFLNSEVELAQAENDQLQARVRELEAALTETRTCSERFHAEARGCETGTTT